MRKKGLFVAILLLLLFGGCDGASQSEERVLPTMDPTVAEQKSDASEEKDVTEEISDNEEEDEDSREDAYEVEDNGKKEEEKNSASGLMSFVEQSKHAVDQNLADTVEIVVEAACIEAQIKGMVVPKEPIRFRYTNELDQLDDSYSLLKEAIRDLMGDDVIELKVEGNYLMVEISKGDDGRTKVEVELLNE